MERTELLTVTDNALTRATSGASAPVFVDTTGRRARRLRLLAIVLVLALVVYVGALASGLFGSSVDLSTMMPTTTASASASAT